jgi:hypothetical protein
VSMAICLRLVELESKHLTRGWIIKEEYSEKSRESESLSMHSRAPLRTGMGMSVKLKYPNDIKQLMSIKIRNLKSKSIPGLSNSLTIGGRIRCI